VTTWRKRRELNRSDTPRGINYWQPTTEGENNKAYYAGWYQTQQQRPEDDEDLEDFAGDWQSGSSNEAEEDELGRWGDGSEEDPFY